MVLRHHLHQVEGQTDLQQLGVLLIRRQSHRHLRFHPAKIKGEWYVTFTRSLFDTFQLFLFIILLCSALLVLFYVTLFRAQQAIQQCVQRALIMAVVLEIGILWSIEVVKMIYRLVLCLQILDAFLSLLKIYMPSYASKFS